MPKLRVEVWSDVACPWCYVGKRRLEAAVARMPSPRDVEVVWRSFQLDPDAPRVRRLRTSYAERLARKYRTSLEQANAMVERMKSLGAAEGITFHLDRVRPGNTFDAHRVLHLAREKGVQGAVKERLMRAYFTEGAAIGDRKTLARLAGEGGLDPQEVRRLLAGRKYAGAVRADRAEARRLAIHAVPFFGLGDEYGVTGAHPVEVLHGALMQAWAAAERRAAPGGAA
jgi:predicted DsbA family dithiol-disulfide isomerase